MNRRLVGLLLSLLVLVLVIIFLLSLEDTADVEQQQAPPALQPTSIETVNIAPEKIEISAFAEVRPRWSAELRAAVSGRILEVSSNALAGQLVNTGDSLIRIENSQYLAEVAAAELAVQQAELDLRLAKSATAIARKQFKADGKKPPNDLSLHLPELAIAESNLDSANAQLVFTKKQLQEATVTAPFSAYVTERFVSPGQSVTIGEPLLKLVDNQTFELTVEISRKDWQLLQHPLQGEAARILDQSNTEIARAAIRQGGGFLDESTRQYKIFLEVDRKAESSLLSGDFVRVVLPGIRVEKALNIPESSLTQDGFVWYLNSSNQLQKLSPEVLHRTDNRLIIRAPEGTEPWRIAVTPLVSFLPGQAVDPQTSGN